MTCLWLQNYVCFRCFHSCRFQRIGRKTFLSRAESHIASYGHTHSVKSQQQVANKWFDKAHNNKCIMSLCLTWFPLHNHCRLYVLYTHCRLLWFKQCVTTIVLLICKQANKASPVDSQNPFPRVLTQGLGSFCRMFPHARLLRSATVLWATKLVTAWRKKLVWNFSRAKSLAGFCCRLWPKTRLSKSGVRFSLGNPHHIPLMIPTIICRWRPAQPASLGFQTQNSQNNQINENLRAN